MACLVVRKPDGSFRFIAPSPDGQYRWRAAEGEVAIREDFNCLITNQSFKVKIGEVQQEVEAVNLLKELDEKLGKGSGDWLKVFFEPVAKAIGKANCMGCEVRRVVTNAYSNLRLKYGKWVALLLMARLWYLSTKDVDLATKKLKGYLNA